MSEQCSLKTLGTYSSMSEEAIQKLEAEIARLEKAYGNDTYSASQEMKEIISNYVADEKYSAVNIIADKIKQERAKRKIIIKGDFKKTVKNLLDFFEANNGIENTYRTFANKYTNQLRSALIRADLEKQFYSGEFDKLIYTEAYNRAHGLPSIKDKTALQLYGIIKKLNNEIHADLKSSGVNLRYRKDFLMSRNYDSQKLIDFGQEAWVKEMKEKYLDLEQTFSKSVLNTEGEVDRILAEVYDDIISTQTTWRPKEFIGKKNSFDKLKGRKFEFKNGELEYEFNKDFGNGKVLGEGLEYQVDRNAKTVANVSLLGTDAQRGFLSIAEGIESEFGKSIPKNELNAALNKAQRAYQEVVAPPHQPSTTFQKSINLLRGLQSFTKLGSSIFAAIYDINSAALQYAVKTGESQFVGYTKAIKEFVKNFSSAERKEFARLLNVNTYFNDAAVVLGGHRGDYDTGFDKINRFFTNAQKFTGVPYQTEMSRVTNALLQADSFTKMVDGLDNLNELQKIAMEKFDLSKNDLQIIKNNLKKNSKTETYVPLDIMDMDNSIFSANDTQARRMKQELFRKFSNYIDQSVQAGTPTPTARVKRHLLKDRSRDEVTRGVANLVMQFKETAYQILLSNKEALNDYYRAKGVTGAGMAMSEYMVLGMISYVAFETAKAAIFDQESPYERLMKGDKDSLRKLAFDYLNKSAVVPLISDAVDQGTSPYFGNNITSYIAGPTLGGTLPDAFNIVKSSNKEKSVRRFVKSNILPSNWIPLKAAQRNLLQYDLIMNEKIRK